MNLLNIEAIVLQHQDIHGLAYNTTENMQQKKFISLNMMV